MSSNNPVSSKSEQVSQQIFEPVRIPVVVGNEVYVVTQQDVRHIIETRHVSCVKCPNGLRDLEPSVGLNSLNVQAPQQQQQYVNTQFQQNLPDSAKQNPPFNLDFINKAANLIQMQCEMKQMPAVEEKERQLANRNFTAPVKTQLDWEMKNCTAVSGTQDQFTYAKMTSTSDLKDYSSKDNSDKCSHNPRRILKILISKGMNACTAELTNEMEQEKKDESSETNPTAKEQQLKQKKKKVIKEIESERKIKQKIMVNFCGVVSSQQNKEEHKELECSPEGPLNFAKLEVLIDQLAEELDAIYDIFYCQSLKVSEREKQLAASTASLANFERILNEATAKTVEMEKDLNASSFDLYILELFVQTLERDAPELNPRRIDCQRFPLYESFVQLIRFVDCNRNVVEQFSDEYKEYRQWYQQKHQVTTILDYHIRILQNINMKIDELEKLLTCCIKEYESKLSNLKLKKECTNSS